MSYVYDEYLLRHKANVRSAFDWIKNNLPDLLVIEGSDCEWQIEFAHDQSKSEPDEYEAYDAYFYGRNRSYAVVEAFRRAWLLHIHRNPHHWQYWILINDDPEEGEVILEMPYEYIVEMICDWWSFSWDNGNLYEIFDWYETRKGYIKLGENTRRMVEDILKQIRFKLDELDGNDSSELTHHGVKGQKWGVRNGPPYPLDKSDKRDTIVEDAIKAGLVSKQINREKQLRHTKNEHIPGRSYLDGDLEFAQELVDKLSGTGEPKFDSHGEWTRKEMVSSPNIIGMHVDPINGKETKTSKATIIYSKTGAHIYPRQEEE